MHAHTKVKHNDVFMYMQYRKQQPYRSIASKGQHSYNYSLKHNNDILRAKDCKRHISSNACTFHGYCHCCYAYGHKAYFCNSRKRDHASPYKHRTKMSFNRYCFYCGDYGHISYNCAMKDKGPNTKLAWVPRSTRTNHEGPKHIWVPKVPN